MVSAAKAVETQGPEADALLALAGLGFRRVEAWPIVSRLIAESGGEISLDDLLRDALRELAK
jgi:Holliday junction DNA helicase RuvA